MRILLSSRLSAVDDFLSAALNGALLTDKYVVVSQLFPRLSMRVSFPSS
jgi:hypothetical protein